MKKVIPLAIALLLSSTCALTSDSSIHHRQSSWQQGILDRALKKIEKEEEMKREAAET